MSSYQYRKSHCGDKTVLRSSYLHNGISYTGKMSSLYWIGAQVLAYNLVEQCTAPWSISLCKMVILGQFLRFPWNSAIFHNRVVPDLKDAISCPNSFKISAISLIFGGMIYSTMKEISRFFSFHFHFTDVVQLRMLLFCEQFIGLIWVSYEFILHGN